MYFYEIWVAGLKFHGQEPLTYSSVTVLEPGTVVLVPVRQATTLGIVKDAVPPPDFTAKPIEKVLDGVVLAGRYLELLTWLRDYYPGPLGAITSLFLPPGLLRENPRALKPKNSEISIKSLPPLTEEQQKALDLIEASKASSFLLHGDTGTGKTRLYLELAKNTLSAGKSVLILTPEIGLTPQLVQDFQQYFHSSVVLIHSRLTMAERRESWLQILNSNEPLVVIGPRSALFSPFNKLGLIVIDEAHESAYKQEQTPRYHAIRVASKLASLSGAKLIMGTATPTISEYYFAEAKELPIIRLKEQALKPKVKTSLTLVNLRERQHFSRGGYLSDQLLGSIRQAIANKEQSLVFLNRRGTARLVLCQVCGWQALCPNCDVPLTYHGDSHNLRCHTCGYKTAPPTVCGNCKSINIMFKSIGTKAIVEALQKEFPNAKIQRFDTDNLKADRLEQHYSAVHAGEVDILVGTQMLAKGLDLPKLSTLGVVLADSSLYFPDYTAEEQTYQLLSQVLGRVGRGHVERAEAIIQTYHPSSTTIEAVVNKDWDVFYKAQIEERRKFLFPPFCFVLKIGAERRSPAAAKEAASKLLNELQALGLPVRFMGPSPSFHEKANGKYKWQLIVKSKTRGDLLKLLPHLPYNFTYDLDPTNLL